MYTIKIESSSDMSHKDNETTQSSLSAEAGVSCRPKQDSSDTVEFSVGNPRVEHITGLVHLYRKVNPQQESESNSFPGALPEERSNRLCILKLPDDLSVAEFCQFLGAHLSKVREMRFVRRETPAVYQPSMVLMRFDEQDTADTFFAEYSRKPFSSLEPDVVCTLVYVKDVEVLSGESLELSPPPGQTELPTCPVCLERLDEHISGVITTVCNHRFHNECLQRWADSSCPVCRYVQQSPNSSHCATCGSRENLWICLICGHVGCGRYMEAHAADHFRESGHCYSLELETQRVWDYVGDGYVHRLIRSHVDGKLVEVPSPSLGGMDPSCEECCQSSDPYMRELEEAQLASKLDAIAQEYNHLLASQLDSQRSYFEAQVAAAGREAEERASAADSKAAEMSARASKAEAEARDAANRSRLVQRKLQEVSQQEAKLREEREFLRNLNDTLISNQKEWQRKVATLESECSAKDEKIKDLQEQLRDLMLYIEAQNAVTSSGEAQEIAGGTLLPLPQEEARRTRRQSKGKNKSR